MDEKADELNEKCKEILAKGIPQLPMPEGMPILDIKITDESFMPEANFSAQPALWANYTEKYLIKQRPTDCDTCFPTAMFNAFPVAFDYDENKLYRYIATHEHPYVPKCESDFSYYIQRAGLSECKELMRTDNMPFITIFAHNMGDRLIKTSGNSLGVRTKFCSHAVAVFGYDDEYLYYFENGLNNVLANSCIFALHNFLYPEVFGTEDEKRFLERIGYGEYAKLWQDKVINGKYSDMSDGAFFDLVAKALLKESYEERGKLSLIRKEIIKFQLLASECYKYANNNTKFVHFNLYENMPSALY